MGVPTITLAGQIAVHRGGASILHNVALDDLITDSVDRYIEAAVSLASSRQKLCHLRATLRSRMRTSILMSPGDFTCDLEEAFVQMWDAKRGGAPAKSL
jgi:predicted O-linked N-acetylglucosamine transferase (SPINDLY family)